MIKLNEERKADCWRMERLIDADDDEERKKFEMMEVFLIYFEYQLGNAWTS